MFSEKQDALPSLLNRHKRLLESYLKTRQSAVFCISVLKAFFSNILFFLTCGCHTRANLFYFFILITMQVRRTKNNYKPTKGIVNVDRRFNTSNEKQKSTNLKTQIKQINEYNGQRNPPTSTKLGTPETFSQLRESCHSIVSIPHCATLTACSSWFQG